MIGPIEAFQIRYADAFAGEVLEAVKAEILAYHHQRDVGAGAEVARNDHIIEALCHGPEIRANVDRAGNIDGIDMQGLEKGRPAVEVAHLDVKACIL